MSLQTSLTRHRGTYYFRLRVPRDLAGEISRKELRLSLRTSRPDEARARGPDARARGGAGDIPSADKLAEFVLDPEMRAQRIEMMLDAVVAYLEISSRATA